MRAAGRTAQAMVRFDRLNLNHEIWPIEPAGSLRRCSSAGTSHVPRSLPPGPGGQAPAGPTCPLGATCSSATPRGRTAGAERLRLVHRRCTGHGPAEHPMKSPGSPPNRGAGGRRFGGHPPVDDRHPAPGDRTCAVTTASDPLVAMARMKRSRPNVILLDLEMPRMDGLTFLKKVMASRSAAGGRLLRVRRAGDPAGHAGAGGGRGRGRAQAAAPARRLGRGRAHALLDIVRAAAQARVQAKLSRPAPTAIRGSGPAASERPPRPMAPLAPAAAVPGRPTGWSPWAPPPAAPKRCATSCARMPPRRPGIVVVQHMPAGFTAAFAEHLNEICRIEVREAQTR